MKIQQLSVFLENKPGQLSTVCHELAQANFNILTLCLADSQQFGILRLILRDWQKAKELLQANGHTVNLTEVVAVEVEDRPGGSAKILDILHQAQANIEYMYAFSFRRNDRAVLVFRFSEPDKAIHSLQQAGINVIDSIELYQLV